MEIKINIDDLRKKSVIIGTPCYGGMLGVPYFISNVDVINFYRTNNLSIKHCMIENESLVTRARNNIVKMFYEDKQYEYLFFIDADIKFDVKGFLSIVSLIDTKHPKTGEQMEVICGSYPKKSVDWNLIQSAVKKEVPANQLNQFIGNQVLNLVPTLDGKQTVNITEPIEVLDTGTGFMCISKNVITKLMKKFPDMCYTPDYALNNEQFDRATDKQVYAFFDTAIVKDETSIQKTEAGIKRYLSEDYFFCKLCREIGIKIWVAPWVNLTHHGTFQYHGNLQAMLMLQNENKN